MNEDRECQTCEYWSRKGDSSGVCMNKTVEQLVHMIPTNLLRRFVVGESQAEQESNAKFVYDSIRFEATFGCIYHKRLQSGSLSLKKQMKKELIPLIEKMIEREMEHYGWLESKMAPKEFIERSRLNIMHLRQRHKEYLQYVGELV